MQISTVTYLLNVCCDSVCVLRMCVYSLFIDILQFTQKVQQMTNNFESAFTTSKFLLNECDLTVFARIRFDMMIK